SSTNAHSEIPENSNYETDVCYQGFSSCMIWNNIENCPTGEINVLSLSSSTNAHIGAFNIYNTKICCVPQKEVIIEECELYEAYWGDTKTVEGTEITMNVIGNLACSGKDILFDIYEVDCGELACEKDATDTGKLNVKSVSATFESNGQAAAKWKAEWIKDTGDSNSNPEYKFEAVIPEKTIFSSTYLEVTKKTDAYWADTGGNKITQAVVQLEYTQVMLILENSELAEGTELTFDIYEKDLWPNPDDFIKDLTANVDSSGNAIASWTVTQEDIKATGETAFDEFYFKVNSETSNSLVITLLENITACNSIIKCSDYNKELECSSELCSVSESDVENKQPAINCGVGYDCYCSWVNNECVAGWTGLQDVCGNSVEEFDEECDDGNLIEGDGCDSICDYECGISAPCSEGLTLCSDGTCAINCNFCDQGSSDCDYNDKCDDNEGCTCADCDNEPDECATGLLCSLEDTGCCNEINNDICNPYCAFIDPDCGGEAVCGNTEEEFDEECDLGLLNGVLNSGCDENCDYECGMCRQTFPDSLCPLGTTLCDDSTCAINCNYCMDEVPNPDCTTPICGDNDVNQLSEDCDGIDLEGETCKTLGYDSGILSCNTDCEFDKSLCVDNLPINKKCGDPNVDKPNDANFNEECDGTNLDGKSCSDLDDYTSGTLGCKSTCVFDTSGCSDGPDPICDKDEVCEIGEGCSCEDCEDGDQDTCANGLTCSVYDNNLCCNKASDNICTPQCAYADPDCLGVCGNGVINTGEEC
ncbi:hypothetical protein KKG51_04935, partial [Patescibacteria group bacterium]|nr:hypothetical protein [Patescibacteria group bacterium]